MGKTKEQAENIEVAAEKACDDTTVVTEDAIAAGDTDGDDAAVEVATVYVHEEHQTKDEYDTFDDETGVETHTEVEVKESVFTPVAETNDEDNAPNAVAIAEVGDSHITAGDDEETGDDSKDVDEEDNAPNEAVVVDDQHTQRAEQEESECKKDTDKCADFEEFAAEVRSLFASIKAENDALKAEIAEIKNNLSAKLVAETQESVNPFMATVVIENKEYGLLKETKQSEEYHLL